LAPAASDSEGHDVAKWLVARGFAAIVLKYRTVQIEGQDAAQLGRSAGARFGAQLRNLAQIDEDGKYGIAYGIQAVDRPWSFEPGHDAPRESAISFSRTNREPESRSRKISYTLQSVLRPAPEDV
jgi:hypothetical protein